MWLSSTAMTAFSSHIWLNKACAWHHDPKKNWDRLIQEKRERTWWRCSPPEPPRGGGEGAPPAPPLLRGQGRPNDVAPAPYRRCRLRGRSSVHAGAPPRQRCLPSRDRPCQGRWRRGRGRGEGQEREKPNPSPLRRGPGMPSYSTMSRRHGSGRHGETRREWRGGGRPSLLRRPRRPGGDREREGETTGWWGWGDEKFGEESRTRGTVELLIGTFFYMT